MKKVLLSFLLFGAILSASTVNVSVISADPIVPVAAENGAPAGPYTLNVNGNSVLGMCMDDFLGANGTWTANVTSLGSSNLSSTMLGNNTSMSVYGYQLSGAQVYTMEAYLFQQLIQPGSDRADLQLAAWSLMNPTTRNGLTGANSTTVQNYLTSAYNNISNVDTSAFLILTDTGGTNQEFMVGTPEPGTLTLLGAGLLAVSAARFRRRKQLDGAKS